MAESTNKINKLTIVVGAGEGYQCMPQDDSHHYLLIDARREAIDLLRRTYAGNSAVKTEQAVATAEPGRSQFYHYSLPEFSSTLKPEALRQLLPGLSLKGSEYVSGVSLSDIIAEELPAEHLELILDVPGQELVLLKSLETRNNLLTLDALTVTSATDMLYEEGNTTSQLNEWLLQQGFKQRQETEQAFGLVTQHWSIDKQAMQIARLESECDDLKQQLSQETKRANSAQIKINELVESLNQAKQARDEAVASASSASKDLEAVTQERDEAVARANNSRHELDKLNAQRNDANQQVEKLSQQLQKAEEERNQQQDYHRNHKQRADNLEEQLKQSKIENEALKQTLETLKQSFGESQSQLLQKIDDVKASQEQATKKLSSAITTSTANTTKQIESFIGVQQFLQTGDSALNFHGWPISSDIAVYLLQKIKQENFDLIIEFGSGTSTVMFAKAVAKQYELQANRQLTSESSYIEHANEGRTKNEMSRYFEQDITEAGELPKRVIAFEHNKKYWNQTISDLKAGGVQTWADVVHSPLVEYSFDGQDYLHYDCENKLSQLAELLEGRQGKVMVLVDGPPGVTCQHARFPALPKLIKALGQHELHFVLDDYNRKEEIEVGEKWIALLEQRGVQIEKEIINFEKKALELVLNRM